MKQQEQKIRVEELELVAEGVLDQKTSMQGGAGDGCNTDCGCGSGDTYQCNKGSSSL